MTRRMLTAAVAGLGLLLWLVPTADAVHFYRSEDGGCTAKSGETTDGPGEDPDARRGQQRGRVPEDVDAEVVLGHNTFHDTSNGTPVTTIEQGESVRWVWSSSHCHSVTAVPTDEEGEPVFDSGFHYPTEAPDSPQAIEGFFEYPVPDPTPDLTYSRTFEEPGTYQYFCVHHGAIGMVGALQVTEAS